MSHLLLTLEASKVMNKAMFGHKLYIYDNKLVYKARTYFIRVTEVTISYNHVAQVYLVRGIYYASLEIINTGGTKDIVIKYVPAKQALHAKRIIDAKIHGLSDEPFIKAGDKKETFSIRKKETGKEDNLTEVEKSLSRLGELLLRKRISKKEFEKKRKEVLKRMR